jgi:acyl-CoA reductase-like NAD-dependent aldehyde dehydrogenase
VNDLIARLRGDAENFNGVYPLLEEAADALEALERELAELRAQTTGGPP